MANTIPCPAQNGSRHSLGVVRRLQALAVASWTRTFLAQELRISDCHLARLYAGRISFEGLALRVIGVYDRLRVQEAPLSLAGRITRGRALAKGWLGPDAWTSAAIDDPAGRPLGQHAMALVEDLQWMLETGESLAGACVRLGIRPNSLYSQLRRIQRLDLWQQLPARGAL